MGEFLGGDGYVWALSSITAAAYFMAWIVFRVTKTLRVFAEDGSQQYILRSIAIIFAVIFTCNVLFGVTLISSDEAGPRGFKLLQDAAIFATDTFLKGAFLDFFESFQIDLIELRVRSDLETTVKFATFVFRTSYSFAFALTAFVIGKRYFAKKKKRHH